MAKRRTEDLNDDPDAENASPQPKRARRSGAEDEDGYVDGEEHGKRAEKQAKRRGKAKARKDDDSEEENAGDVNIANEDEFEGKFGQKIQQSLEANKTRRTAGGIAEMGIIERVEMHNFMCHKYLQFDFGPQINFIIGHNGSGKSACLSAITVALGGKATSTGRGSGLKSFIKEGETIAEVIVCLKNRGNEAFRHGEYGDTIRIVRKFSKDGASSYKIQAKNEKTISTKREDLSAICDHMNIQVDNPMNILTQDAARQFLSAANPSDKYQFFLKGTQLRQLSEEYEVIKENIEKTDKILQQKKEVIPDLDRAFRDASDRYKEAEKARAQADKVEELKRELAWAHVAAKAEELEEKMATVIKLHKLIPELQGKIAEADNQFEAANQDVITYEGNLDNVPKRDDLSARKDELQTMIKANKQRLMEATNDEKNINNGVKAKRKAISELEHQIADETAKLQVDGQAKREQLQSKLSQITMEIKSLDDKMSEAASIIRSNEAKCGETQAEGDAMKKELDQLGAELDQAKAQVQQLEAQKKDKLSRFGNNIAQVLQDIERQKWTGVKPLGPLGMFVDLKDGMWADLMRSTIGSQMSAFAISHDKDRLALKKILTDRGNRMANIIVASEDLFDYSQGEPPSQFTTILRVLDIKHEWVKRILINQNKIEKTILAPTRPEGQELVDRNPTYTCMTADCYRLQTYADGGRNNVPLNRIHGGDPRAGMFQRGDVQSLIINFQTRIAEVTARGDSLNSEWRAKGKVYSDAKQSSETATREHRRLGGRKEQLRRNKEQIENEAQEEAPVNIGVLDDAKKEQQQEMESLMHQYEVIATRKATLHEELKPLVVEKEQIRHSQDELEGEKIKLEGMVAEAAQARLDAQNSRNHYTKKLADQQALVDKAEELAVVVQTEFETWTAKAEQICDRVERPRTVRQLENALGGLQRALADQTRRSGASVEQIRADLDRAQNALDKAKSEIKGSTQFNKAMGIALKDRMHKWQEFRMHIALRCKYQFQHHLSARGFYGRILFDHVTGKLELKVQTEESIVQTAMNKDPKSMSGGEKSFSTICLLLSLWEAIGCPIRALDEFDVFMDSVNRRISMGMMIDTAKASDRKQYILITPQDMTNVQLGPEVKVHRMTDPERRQLS